jgi:hypothetical protein
MASTASGARPPARAASAAASLYVAQQKPFLLAVYSGTPARWAVPAGAAAVLASRPDVPIVSVGIAGPMRTGKSYIMNLFAGEQNGFELGPYMEAQTIGIWAWFPAALNPRGAGKLS